MKVDIKGAAELLRDCEDILILTHQNPDGDTLGSGFGLYFALNSMGKRVRVENSDHIPQKYNFMLKSYAPVSFVPKVVIAVDTADVSLFGDKLIAYKDQVMLCIDHHKSNTGYAQNLLLDDTASAASELVFQVIEELTGHVCVESLTCIYTGVCTDTGCFRYSNTTQMAHQIAIRALQYGIDIAKINRLMFEVKSLRRMEVEKLALATLEYFYDSRCAVMYVTQEMYKKSGADESEVEGLAPATRQIEGVEVGVLIKERPNGEYKISVRTGEQVDACAVCNLLGGGGHTRAAGCTVHGTLDLAKEKIIKVIGQFL